MEAVMAARAEQVSLGEWTLRVLVVLLLGIVLLGVWYLRDVFLLVFFAAIMAIVLQMPVRALQRIGLNRGLSVAMTLIGAFAVLVVTLVLMIPIFIDQVRDLADVLPQRIDDARIEYNRLIADEAGLPRVEWYQTTEQDIEEFLHEQGEKVLSHGVFPFLSGLSGALTSIVFTFFIAVFFVVEPINYLEGMLTLVPRGYRPRALEIFHKLGVMAQRWFVGQLISMTLTGALITFVTGVILGLPNAIALGVISGLMEFIPNFGSIIAVIPALIIALATRPVLVPFVILAYLITQQIQSNLLMPRIMSRQISLPAATILVAQITGAALFGFLGILLALPLVIVVTVFVREIYVYDVLNTRPARLQTHMRPDGSTYTLVTSETYRPERLSPGEAARLQAEGRDLFGEEIVEIITPTSPVIEQAARSQQMVWWAILALTVTQVLALVRTLLEAGRDD
jgi:predicted PurR-regulated permease PerM